MDSPKDAETSPRRARGRPRGWEDNSAQNTIKSLDRAMEVLDYLSAHPGLTLSELAGDLRQSPATVYRILVTLEGRRLVEFDPAEQLWHIGPQAFVIGARFLRRTSLVERARPILRALMEETGETANLGIVREASVLFVSQVETHESIRAFFPPGTLSPLHASGIGKALLAEMAGERLEKLLARKMERFTVHTLAEPEALRADLAAIRARGYSIDAEEKNLGMRCIAAAVFDASGEAAAGISVSGPTIRMREDMTDETSRAVMRAARELTSAIGGVTPPER
ncbi:HTH-type transcriptional regulator BhcR [Alloyangia pacifica]|uniref:HTH-type transcriptional regulator BhcR n=1 Tax=Alloyangia pacifica TaxID=311180 RepID=UPI001CD1EE35|nr:HTH-type transcriptional regulator BhcR [Alloyangia pacifica]MCA0998498.1 IclR family transcriptional regulator [Alloyangia pacifica]